MDTVYANLVKVLNLRFVSMATCSRDLIENRKHAKTSNDDDFLTQQLREVQDAQIRLHTPSILMFHCAPRYEGSFHLHTARSLYL